MNNLKVKELMIPVSEYTRVSEDRTLQEAMQLLADDANRKNLEHAHRDLLVEDKKGRIIGKVTMADIFNYMEPQYEKIRSSNGKHVLEYSLVQKIFRDFDLWSQPLENLCERAAATRIKDIMHEPEKSEYLTTEASLERALHNYIMGIHQPMLITENDEVVGVLRLGDVFEKVRQAILTCEM